MVITCEELCFFQHFSVILTARPQVPVPILETAIITVRMEVSSKIFPRNYATHNFVLHFNITLYSGLPRLDAFVKQFSTFSFYFFKNLFKTPQNLYFVKAMVGMILRKKYFYLTALGISKGLFVVFEGTGL